MTRTRSFSPSRIRSWWISKIGEGKENMFMTDEQFAEFAKQHHRHPEHGRGCAFPARPIDSQAITGGLMTAFSHKTS